MRMWVGNEMEGTWEGKKTLFIQGSEISVNDIKKALVLYKDIEQLYFGAGGCSNFDTNVIMNCYKVFPRFLITLELDIGDVYMLNKRFIERINLIVTINNVLFSRIVDNSAQIKFQSLKKRPKVIGLVEFNSSKFVDLSTLKRVMYKNDIEITKEILG